VTDILQLSSLKTISVTPQEDSYLIVAEGRLVPTVCPDCRAGRLYGHGTNEQSYRDTPIHGKTVQITVNRRRYRCQACGKTLFDPIPDLDSKRLATSRLIAYVRKTCFRETFAVVARRVAMDEKTVRQIFADYIEELESKIRFVTPRFLGIDEIKIIGDYRAMITNIEHQTLFDMRESRKKPDLLAYFQALRDKDRVEWVTMDMYHVYRQVVQATLPQARIIVDRFHIQRMANDALEKLRKRLRKTLPERQRLKLKDERFLLLRRQHDLKSESMATLLDWFRRFPQLSEAHAIKEGFFSIWDHKGRPAAEAAYAAWLSTVSPEMKPVFKDLLTALANWEEEIFSYFEQPVTNAYTESVNGLAKGMNRMGRGYSFDVIRARMLYDPIARKKGAVIVDEPIDQPEQPTTYEYFMTGQAGKPVRVRRRVVEHGAHIPTLVKLLESGYFEQTAEGET
jgi:transposase